MDNVKFFLSGMSFGVSVSALITAIVAGTSGNLLTATVVMTALAFVGVGVAFLVTKTEGDPV